MLSRSLPPATLPPSELASPLGSPATVAPATNRPGQRCTQPLCQGARLARSRPPAGNAGLPSRRRDGAPKPGMPQSAPLRRPLRRPLCALPRLPAGDPHGAKASPMPPAQHWDQRSRPEAPRGHPATRASLHGSQLAAGDAGLIARRGGGLAASGAGVEDPPGHGGLGDVVPATSVGGVLLHLTGGAQNRHPSRSRLCRPVCPG